MDIEHSIAAAIVAAASDAESPESGRSYQWWLGYIAGLAAALEMVRERGAS